MRTLKRKKSTRMHGRKMGTHGWGARKKHKKSGHKGGIGMAGSGKRADQKKTLVLKLYGNKYFGKQGITSKRTKKDKTNKINLSEIESNIENYIKKGIAKQIPKGYEINLEDYIILGDGEINEKLIIKAKKASESALEKVKESGGEIILHQKNSENKKMNKKG